MQAKPSTEQCYLYYSCAVCTVLLIKYEIINLVHHLRPFTKNYNFQALWETNKVEKKLTLSLVKQGGSLSYQIINRSSPLIRIWVIEWQRNLLSRRLSSSAPIYCPYSITTVPKYARLEAFANHTLKLTTTENIETIIFY